MAAVLHLLRYAGLTANPTKCEIGKDEACYLGRRVAGGQDHPLVDRVHALQAYKTPYNQMAGACIPGFSRLQLLIHTALHCDSSPINQFNQGCHPLEDMMDA